MTCGVFAGAFAGGARGTSECSNTDSTPEKASKTRSDRDRETAGVRAKRIDATVTQRNKIASQEGTKASRQQIDQRCTQQNRNEPEATSFGLHSAASARCRSAVSASLFSCRSASAVNCRSSKTQNQHRTTAAQQQSATGNPQSMFESRQEQAAQQIAAQSYRA